MLLWVLSIAAAETLYPGEVLDEAVLVHITAGGFQHLGDLVEAALPREIPATGVSGEYACSEEESLSYALEDTALLFTVQAVELIPGQDRLDLDITLTLATTPSTMTVVGDCSFLSDLDEVCDVEMPVTVASAAAEFSLSLVDGEIEVLSTPVTFEISPIGNPLSGCLLSDAIGTLLDQNDRALSDLVVSLVEPELEGLGETLSSAIADAVDSLVIETDLSLGEGDVHLTLFPTRVELDPTGLALGLGSQITPTALTDCVPLNEGSELGEPGWPALSERAWETSLPYDIGLLINRDFTDHLLWNVWATGGLCFEMEQLEGQPIQTDLFASFLGDSFRDLFTNSSEALLNLAPQVPPTLEFQEDGAPFVLAINDIAIDLQAQLDERWIRVFRTSMGTEIGVDPGLSADALSPSFEMEDSDFLLVEEVNELLEPGFSEGLAGFVETLLLTNILPSDLLPSSELPSLFGAGLSAVFWLPDPSWQWQGGFVLLDLDSVEPLEATGCTGGELGCDSSLDLEGMLGCTGEDSELGCSEDTGCSSGDSGCSGSSCATHQRSHNVLGGRFALAGLCLLLGLSRRWG